MPVTTIGCFPFLVGNPKPSFVTGILGGGGRPKVISVGKNTMFGIWRGDVMVLDSAFCDRNGG